MSSGEIQLLRDRYEALQLRWDERQEFLGRLQEDVRLQTEFFLEMMHLTRTELPTVIYNRMIRLVCPMNKEDDP